MIKDFKAGIKVCQAVLVRVQKVGNSSNGGVLPAVCWRITADALLLSALMQCL